MTDDEPTDEDVSFRDRATAFVDEIEDVPGVTASVSGFGEAAFARVDVDDDYGNRDEYGNGNVCVAPNADDPVGRQAFDHGMRIVRVSRKDREDQNAFRFAPSEAYDDVEQ